MLGGYTWNAFVDGSSKTIHLDIYLFVSATRTIKLPNGEATIRMRTEMPWQGKTEFTTKAPEGWKWEIRVPKPEYASNISVRCIFIRLIR